MQLRKVTKGGSNNLSPSLVMGVKLCGCLFLALFALLFTSCEYGAGIQTGSARYGFPQIMDISYTPGSIEDNRGWFTDAGSWMGYTIPEDKRWINGFCGPFSLDVNRRQWLSHAAVTVSYADFENDRFNRLSHNCFPGEIFISAANEHGSIMQTLNFIDASNALLTIETDNKSSLLLTGENWSDEMELRVSKNMVTACHSSGEIVQLTFPHKVDLSVSRTNYRAIIDPDDSRIHVVISFYSSEKELSADSRNCLDILNNYHDKLVENSKRWDSYLSKVLRKDMKPEYDRIAVKAIVTLVSNWRTHRGGLLHEGIVPSHGVDCFVGFRAWDTWQLAAATARFHPELAKSNIRAMFDYQLDDGMVVDRIYSDPSGNNMRNSEPPLASWAVDEVFKHTSDTSFVKEMYPQLLAYYDWWYEKRDHDGNGVCEYGSTDGTLEAAAWESGVGNAIRFDDTEMLNNKRFDDAWSMDQESVDLNAYLMLEYRLLKKFAGLLNVEFNFPERSGMVRDYFYDDEKGFFFDRKVGNGDFVREYGCEAYTPLWARIATDAQVSRMIPLLADTEKFATCIPCPTASANNPKCDPRGYWRESVWLGQTYFAIRGLRNYGYDQLADKQTVRLFERLGGLTDNAAIHENCGTHAEEKLKAPHFSWSAAHLLMLYDDFAKSTR